MIEDGGLVSGGGGGDVKRLGVGCVVYSFSCGFVGVFL